MLLFVVTIDSTILSLSSLEIAEALLGSDQMYLDRTPSRLSSAAILLISSCPSFLPSASSSLWEEPTCEPSLVEEEAAEADAESSSDCVGAGRREG